MGTWEARRAEVLHGNELSRQMMEAGVQDEEGEHERGGDAETEAAPAPAKAKARQPRSTAI